MTSMFFSGIDYETKETIYGTGCVAEADSRMYITKTCKRMDWREIFPESICQATGAFAPKSFREGIIKNGPLYDWNKTIMEQDALRVEILDNFGNHECWMCFEVRKRSSSYIAVPIYSETGVWYDFDDENTTLDNLLKLLENGTLNSLEITRSNVELEEEIY